METKIEMTFHAQEGKDDDGKEENCCGDALDSVLEALLESSDESNTNLFHVLMKTHAVDGAMRVYRGVPFMHKMGAKK